MSRMTRKLDFSLNYNPGYTGFDFWGPISRSAGISWKKVPFDSTHRDESNGMGLISKPYHRYTFFDFWAYHRYTILQSWAL